MMLSGIQAKLVYQEFKLLLQNVWINHHKFIPAATSATPIVSSQQFGWAL